MNTGRTVPSAYVMADDEERKPPEFAPRKDFKDERVNNAAEYAGLMTASQWQAKRDELKRPAAAVLADQVAAAVRAEQTKWDEEVAARKAREDAKRARWLAEQKDAGSSAGDDSGAGVVVANTDKSGATREVKKRKKDVAAKSKLSFADDEEEEV